MVFGPTIEEPELDHNGTFSLAALHTECQFPAVENTVLRQGLSQKAEQELEDFEPTLSAYCHA
ncbi:MAG: hypothetical protein U5K71_12815 [Gracilimonas sp.]|nr:hypothetical protein [Gracilimonas sp.]